ncbi:unnamed protein product, partial [Ascophyllum nodosum]
YLSSRRCGCYLPNEDAPSTHPRPRSFFVSFCFSCVWVYGFLFSSEVISIQSVFYVLTVCSLVWDRGREEGRLGVAERVGDVKRWREFVLKGGVFLVYHRPLLL